MDSAEANQHGKVALQSPVAGTQVIEGTAVTLSVYRVASLVHAAQVDITLPESDASIDVRITLVDDEGIEDRGLRRHPGRGQPAEHHRDH